MAETEELIELGWKLGFFGPVSNAVSTHSFQIITHGGSTEISVECSIIERCKIAKITSKLSQN